MLRIALFHIAKREANEQMVLRSNEAIRSNINWNIVWGYNMIKNTTTSMRFLADLLNQNKIFKKWVAHFRFIVFYMQSNVTITQENNNVK